MIFTFAEFAYEGVKHLPLIKTKFLNPKIDFYLYNSLIITSKTTIKALSSYHESWKQIPAFLIGEKSANEARNVGANVSYISKISYGDEFAQEILPFIKNKKVLYLRGDKTVSNIQEILIKNNIQVSTKILYKTIKNNEIQNPPQKNSILIFTSPFIVKCFFEKFIWDDSWKIVSIGKKTSAFLPKNVKFMQSNTQSIEECVNLAKKL